MNRHLIVCQSLNVKFIDMPSIIKINVVLLKLFLVVLHKSHFWRFGYRSSIMFNLVSISVGKGEKVCLVELWNLKYSKETFELFNIIIIFWKNRKFRKFCYSMGILQNYGLDPRVTQRVNTRINPWRYS